MDPITAKLMSAAGAASDPIYVDDVFAASPYQGTGSTLTIDDGIDLSGEGGMVWIKGRSNTTNNMPWDPERGARKYLITDSTNAESTSGSNAGLTQFNSNGFTLGSNWNTENFSPYYYCAWTFRKCPGFFDVVKYTGDGQAGRQISHSLGSTPGMVIVKRIDAGSSKWAVWHTGAGDNYRLYLNENTSQNYTDSHIRSASSTTFTVGSDYDVNTSGGAEYIAYIFANNDQSFGTAGNESIIKCGSYSGNSGSQSINVGFEPQFVLVKGKNTTSNWQIHDTSRKFALIGTGEAGSLRANKDWPEYVNANRMHVTRTGFEFDSESSSDCNASGVTYIYMAIRRENKPPEAATEVFKPIVSTSANNKDVGFPIDLCISQRTNGANCNWSDRLRSLITRTGTHYVHSYYFTTANSNAETTDNSANQDTHVIDFDFEGFTQGTSNELSTLNFKRAPGFFDMVGYAGTSTIRTQAHSLGVVPEMIMIKDRDGNYPTLWVNGMSTSASISPASTGGETYSKNPHNGTAPTSSVFTLRNESDVNFNGHDYIAYLWATLAGISKVGTYTGTGNDLDIDCGFTNGARFVLVKRYDTTGNWIYWTSEMGIVSGTEAYLRWNTSNSKQTGYDYIDPLNSGFTITSNAPSELNASSGKYLFLAIA